MRTIIRVRIGSGSENIGFKITRHWIMAVTLAGFVVVGLHMKKSRWTILYPGKRVTCLTLVIFNQPMAVATIIRAPGELNPR